MPVQNSLSVPDLQQETTEILKRLIAFNTVNPPGNEHELQQYLAQYLEDAGFECELLAAEPERPNLLARLRGRQDGPVLGYLGHVDTVLANAAEWSHDPWSGELVDGFLWGRGALDMKSQVAAEVAATAALARSGWRPARGELLVMAVVDEETGGVLGAQWLTEQHPDKVRCDYLINEGAGAVFEYQGRRYYGVCCAEKGVFQFSLTAEGIAAHASMPRMGDNALMKLAPVLDRLAAFQPELDLTPEVEAFLAGIGELDGAPEQALERVRAADAQLGGLLEPMLGVTLAPTRIRASEKINVIPSRAELQVDCRVPPGLGEDTARKRIEQALDGESLELQFTERIVGNSSSIESPLMDSLRSWVATKDPGAEVVPTVLPGFTDSRWFRTVFPACTAYGFCPHKYMSLHDSMPLIHAADERIDVRDLGFAAQLFYDLPQELLG